MIEVQNLRVLYGRTIALDSIDVRIEEGITGLFGQNGSGKSTLLRAIAGLLRPNAGSISLDGFEPRDSNESVRGAIGYSGHASGLYGRLTLAENLELFARLHGVARTRVDETIASLELGAWADTRAGGLSAGLSRRASVARAILHEPKYLLLDEPYANLDDEASDIVSNAIRSWKQPDRVAVVATHGAKRVKAYADAGLILERGTVRLQGSYAHDGAAV